MRSAYTLFLFVALAALIACDSGAVKEKKPDAVNDTMSTATTESIDLSNTDSVELLHFNDPANQRIYSRSLIKDTHFIQQIIRNVHNTPVQHASCGNDFKLFFFRNGDVYKTIYASTADTCRYFAYVINGQTFFTDMNDSALALLNAAMKP